MTRRAVLLAALTCLAMTTLAPARQPPQAAAPVKLSAYDDQANALLARMTLEEKVGQMTQPDQQFLEDVTDIQTYFLGSLLSGGDSDPVSNSVPDWTDMYDRYQSYALETRLRIPLLYGVDAVHGHSNVVGAVIFPHNIGLGATRNAALVEEIARITAREVRATGINWTFGPCVTVPRDERWGRTYEGFSEDPALVAELGAAAVRGFQGADLRDPLGILACAKHYLADGGTAWGTGMPASDRPGGRYPLDRGDARMDEATLRRIHLAPYLPAIEAGAGSIMVSYSSWNGAKLSGHKYLLTDVLKEELGFEGFLLSDYNAIDALSPDYRVAVRQTINAGMDMVMVPDRYRTFYGTLMSLVKDGEVPMSRIDDAVRRILRVKFAMGLMDEGRSPLADRRLHETVGSAAHRAVARRAVRESLVLLWNERRTLPLSRGLKRIHIAGTKADDLGAQCGGWTIRWQGQRGPVTLGTTLLAALQQTVSPPTQLTFSADGSGAAGADAAIVVAGEAPYAEFLGDAEDLRLPQEDLDAIAAVRQTGVPTVVILFSGRPLIIDEALEQSDALLAAWLPGTEGQGIVDVLFGDHAPSGRLPFTWPRSMAQIPLNSGDADYDPLFPFGFGLSYE